jgi:hypothetical integral membrane protein (TIGR02206 family)
LPRYLDKVRTDFVLFGPAHLLILASIPVAGLLLAAFQRIRPLCESSLRLGLGTVLLVNELAWYAYRLGWERVPLAEAAPLQLCDLALWLTVVTLFTLKYRIYEIAYFAALAGSSMAALTPDLHSPAWSYPTFYFFLAHGGTIAGVLYLTWSKRLWPQPGCLWRVLVEVNLFMAFAGAFNAVFGTNYMYLRAKPDGASLLNYMGPWPVYIAAGEVVALAIFTLLWLPFKFSAQRQSRRTPAGPAPARPGRS